MLPDELSNAINQSGKTSFFFPFVGRIFRRKQARQRKKYKCLQPGSYFLLSQSSWFQGKFLEQSYAFYVRSYQNVGFECFWVWLFNKSLLFFRGVPISIRITVITFKWLFASDQILHWTASSPSKASKNGCFQWKIGYHVQQSTLHNDLPSFWELWRSAYCYIKVFYKLCK